MRIDKARYGKFLTQYLTCAQCTIAILVICLLLLSFCLLLVFALLLKIYDEQAPNSTMMVT